MKRKNNNKQSATMTINQDMTIINAEVLKEKMEIALNSTSTLNLNLKNVEVMDLAGIQLIYALKKEAVNQKKKLKIVVDLKSEAEEMIKSAGFGDLLNN